MLDVPARRAVSTDAVFPGHVLRDVILPAALSRVYGDSSRAPETICFVLWQCLLPRVDQPSSLDRLQKLFLRVCTKPEMSPLSFLLSFPTSQETFTLLLKDDKKDLKYFPKSVCAGENPYVTEGGNSRDISTITA